MQFQFKGRLQSRTVESIEREIKSLVDRGFFEFTFISQDSSSFGRDLGLRDGLIDLIDMVDRVDGVQGGKSSISIPPNHNI